MQSEMVNLPAGTDCVGQLKDAVRAKLSAARGGRPVELLQLQLVEDVVGAEATEDALQTAKRVSLGLAGAKLDSKEVTTGCWLFATLAEPAGALRVATTLAGEWNTHQLSGGDGGGHGAAASLVCMSSHSRLSPLAIPPFSSCGGLPRAPACRLWPALCTRLPIAPRAAHQPLRVWLLPRRRGVCSCALLHLPPRLPPSPTTFPALPSTLPRPPRTAVPGFGGGGGGGGGGVGAPAGVWEGCGRERA